MMSPKIRILIVEDELLIAEDLREMLDGMGYEVMGVKKTGEDAVIFSLEHDLDLILMDINLSGDIDGIDAAEQIKNRKDIPIIFLTAFATETIVARAKRTKPSGYILKPYSEAQIRTSIEIALYNFTLESRLKERNATVRMLINTTEDALMIFNVSGIIEFVNKAMAGRVGKPADEIIGMRIEDLKSAGLISEGIFDQLTSAGMGKSVTIEEQAGVNWYEYSLIPVQNTDEKVTQIGYSCHDITFHKYIELGLQETIHNLNQEREMLEQTREEIHLVNEDLQAYNRALSAEFGSIQKMMTKNQLILSLIHAGDVAIKEGLDEPAFLQNICDLIVSYGKYADSWIISTSSSGNPIHMVMSNQNHPYLSEFIEAEGILKFCPALGVQEVTSFKAGGETCISCPLSDKHGVQHIFTAPIRTDDKILGVVGFILISEENLVEQEEISAIIDISSNIGFALQFVRSSVV